MNNVSAGHGRGKKESVHICSRSHLKPTGFYTSTAKPVKKKSQTNPELNNLIHYDLCITLLSLKLVITLPAQIHY